MWEDDRSCVRRTLVNIIMSRPPCSSSGGRGPSATRPPYSSSGGRGPSAIIFDDVNTLYDGGGDLVSSSSSRRAAPLPEVFPDVIPIFTELRSRHIHIIILERCPPMMRKVLLKNGFLNLEFISIPAEEDDFGAVLQKLLRRFPRVFDVMVVSAKLAFLQRIQKWTASGVLTVQARQVGGVKGLTPAAILAPFRYGWPLMIDEGHHDQHSKETRSAESARAPATRRLPFVLSATSSSSSSSGSDSAPPWSLGDYTGGARGGPASLLSKTKHPSFGETAVSTISAEVLAGRMRVCAESLVSRYVGLCPVLCTVLRHDDFGFCFSADLIRCLGAVPGFHADLAFLTALDVSALDGLQERESHPDKWRHRDVVLLVGRLMLGKDVGIVGKGFIKCTRHERFDTIAVIVCSRMNMDGELRAQRTLVKKPRGPVREQHSNRGLLLAERDLRS